jgi:uncharacterized SAM-binding protein YcdF (DUF218 family)
VTYSQPLMSLAVLLCLWTVFRLRRTGRKGRWWLDFAGVAAVFTVASPAAAWLAAASLERHYAASHFPVGDADAIVALSANSYPANSSQPETEPGNSTYLRTAHAAWLFHNWKRVPILVSGGPMGRRDGTLAALMKRQLLRAGVPDGMIWVEDRSTSTHENARESAAILRERGIRRVALVTEGFHMLRSELCFRKQGLEVASAPCAFRTLEVGSAAALLLPSMWGLRVNEECLHEWVGLVWYKIKGQI